VLLNRFLAKEDRTPPRVSKAAVNQVLGCMITQDINDPDIDEAHDELRGHAQAHGPDQEKPGIKRHDAHVLGLEHAIQKIIPLPVIGKDAALAFQAVKEPGTRVRRQDRQ